MLSLTVFLVNAYNDLFLNLMDFYPDEVLNLISSAKMIDLVYKEIYTHENYAYKQGGFSYIIFDNEFNVNEVLDIFHNQFSSLYPESDNISYTINDEFISIITLNDFLYERFFFWRKKLFIILFNINFLIIKFFFFKVTEVTFWLLPQLILLFGGLLSFLLIKTNDLNIKIWNLT